MGKAKWTPAQSNAIEARNKSLMVSAAAGSGKTAVLTERIIGLICDEEARISVNDMLIVTYTRLAAAELKERLYTALAKKVAENPKSRFLAAQLTALPGAKISTIHAFCFSLIKENFSLLGLPAKLRIAEEIETKILVREEIEALIEELYEAIPSDAPITMEDFLFTGETFSNSRDDAGFLEAVNAAYNDLVSHPDYLKRQETLLTLLKDETEKLEKGEITFFDTRVGKVIERELKNCADELAKTSSRALENLKLDEEAYKKNSKALLFDADFYGKLSALTYTGDYKKIKEWAESVEAFPRLGKSSGSPALEDSAFSHTEAKKSFGSNFLPLIAAKEEDIPSLFRRTLRVETSVSYILKLLDERIFRRKCESGAIDFNDIEQLSYKLLVDSYDESTDTLTVTEAAINCRDQLKAVFIDEYQDTNLIQDLIFRAISKEDNRFIVGDEKQSIYAFRGADPSVFRKYDVTLPEYSKDSVEKMEKIYLSNNFRCNKPIVDFVNRVFADIMLSGGENAYPDIAKLVFSKLPNPQIPPENITPEIRLFVSPDKSDSEAEKPNELEFIVSKTKELLNSDKRTESGEPIDPSDIAVLARSNATLRKLAELFENAGIQTVISGDFEFFESEEILLMLSILNTIDNPTRDVYLIAALSSPIFSFTSEELLKIRSFKKNAPFYEALTEAANSEEKDGKIRAFLSQISDWREKARVMTLPNLIRNIFESSMIFTIYSNSKNYERRKNNLLSFYEYARAFDASAYKGLYNFLAYINDLMSGKTTPRSSPEKTKGRINLLTIHASKGLEFPIVFFTELGKNYSASDGRTNYVFSNKLGRYSRVLDSTGFTKVNSPLRRAALIENDYLLSEEHTRLLYVALTRAREQLILTASLSTAALNRILLRPQVFTPYAILHLNSPIDTICHALNIGKHKDRIAEILSNNIPASISEEYYTLNFQTEAYAEETPTADSRYCKTLGNLSSVEKAISVLESDLGENGIMPAKVSVSEYLRSEKEEIALPRTLNEEIGAGARRGSAMHAYMQFCNYENAEISVTEEARRLAEKGFISKEDVSLLNFFALNRFFNSASYKRIKNSANVKREMRFNVLVPAKELFETDSDENVLMQGVIDCFYEEADGTYTVIDYKTDFVKGKDGEKILRTRHSKQLRIYADAIERITGKKVGKAYLYSFALGRCLEVNRKEKLRKNH